MNEYNNLEFKTIMKFCRSRTGRSARQVSEEAGVSQSYVSKIESGAIAPTLENFAKIAKVLEINGPELEFIIHLLGGDADEV